MLGIWLIVAAIVVLAIYVIYVFNKLVRTKNRVNNAWSQIDVQLRRRQPSPLPHQDADQRGKRAAHRQHHGHGPDLEAGSH